MYKDFKNKHTVAYKSTSFHTIILFNKERVTYKKTLFYLTNKIDGVAYKKNIIPVNTKIISSTKHIELHNTLFHLTNIQKTINSAKKNQYHLNYQTYRFTCKKISNATKECTKIRE